MKLYDFPNAPNPRRVRVVAAEKGIELDYVTVDMTKR
ncbi:MAG: glutathione S-transferase, partial [Pseudomonadota bacterium]|nr:glutathione S-transferase [Pseudomonadota bacterium]MEE3174847.1 glutathione S-transferase [Pseudomonadota bacterium]